MKKKHIVHIVYSFKVGGLENGVVNLVNHLSNKEFQHTIVCLSDYDEDFYARIKQKSVEIHCLNKRSGNDVKMFVKLWFLLKKINPNIVHTRNLATVECQFIAWLANVEYRVHGEHGWDMVDLHGGNNKYIKLRKLLKPFIHQFVALSTEGLNYLQNKIGIKPQRLNHICNGVDTNKFKPEVADLTLTPNGFITKDCLVFGTVGRMAEVKNQLLLVDAFIDMCQENITLAKEKYRLIIVGDGEFYQQIISVLTEAGLISLVWLPGGRNDIPQLMNLMDVFVLPSLAEGISNTILEAFASGLPVIATDVGGNGELVKSAHNGELILSNNIQSMVTAMKKYNNKNKLILDAEHALYDAQHKFSLNNMVNKYSLMYNK
jgi:sugar transferase (PEP-CTERM/EpsH1 system associated)